MESPSRFATALRTSLLVLGVVGLGLALGFGAWLLWQQHRRIVVLEATVDRLQGVNLRISHWITTEREQVGQSIRGLRQEVAALKTARPGDDPKALANPPASIPESSGRP